MLTTRFLERLQREKERFYELEEQLSDTELVRDPARLKQLTQDHVRLKRIVEPIQTYLSWYEQWQDANQMLREESDTEMQTIASEELAQLSSKLETKKREMELLLLPPSPHAGRTVFMEIRAGTGGEEAALFVADLMRMYLRFAERHAMKSEIIQSASTELGGYKEIVFSISGPEVYTLLHQEAGAHRVQRIPTTESGGRIHTSAVTVAVLPEREESEVAIHDADLNIDVFRASGAGGQHVNKTESAIRITHIPSGLVVSCQDERSQLKNKIRAMRILRTRLAQLQEEKNHKEHNTLKRAQIKSGDRSERIRTYNFPQGRVTDHRIGYTAYNLEMFMDGDMDELLNALVEVERETMLQVL